MSAGELCEFSVKWVCNQGTSADLKERKETDKERFAKCGDQLKARADEYCKTKVVESKEFFEFKKYRNVV